MATSGVPEERYIAKTFNYTWIKINCI